MDEHIDAGPFLTPPTAREKTGHDDWLRQMYVRDNNMVNNVEVLVVEV